MNQECRLNSASSTPRIQQPRRTLSPSEYAAAGDAPRGQIALDQNLGTDIETFAMDRSLLSPATNDADKNSKSKFNDLCVHPNAGRVFNLSNEPLENVSSVVGKPSSLIRCTSSSKQYTIEENFNYRNSPEREQPCKEYSRDTGRSGNYENLADNELKSLSKVIGTSEEGDQRHSTEDYNMDNILSPDRKVSMFSAEIWTEKVLPIDTFVCPEPELVEIYFDKNKMTGELNRFSDYSTESIDVSATWRSSNRSVLGRNILLSPPLSAKKSRTSSSGQKTVNFDDEIWSVCPKLIPSGKELSDSSNFENGYEVIPPEKLINNGTEIAAVSRLQTCLLKSASIFGVSPKASKNQYDLEDNARNERAIEPTHEIEGQSDFESIGSQAKKFCDNNSRTETSPAKISAAGNLESYRSVEKISRGKSLVTNVPGQTDDTDYQTVPGTTQRLEDVCSGKQETRSLKMDPLSTNNNESVDTMLGNILNRRATNSVYEAEFPAVSCGETLSWEKFGVKRKREKYGSTLPTISKRIDASLVKNNDSDYNNFSKTVSTPAYIIRAIPQDLDKLKTREQSIESASRDQSSCDRIRVTDNQVKPSDSKSFFKDSIIKQETKKNRKCVKTVRFKVCGRHSSIKIHGSGTELQPGNPEDRDIEPGRSKMHLVIENTSDSISVESFKQEIDQLASQIARQIERDETSDDAVEILAKVEVIVEANRQAAERLQKLQPHSVIPRLIPPDAGKSIAKALLRCRNYMQTNGYSHDATNTLNKLLMSAVQSLKQSVVSQKQALAQEKHEAVSEGRRPPKRIHQANFSNTNGVLTPDYIAGDQVQHLISDILKATRTIVPKLSSKETQKKPSIVPSYLHYSVRNVARNARTPVNTACSKTDTTNFTKDSKVNVEAYKGKVTHPLGAAVPNTAEEVEKPITTMLFKPPSNQTKGNHTVDKDSSIPAPTNSKKIASTDPTKTLKKLFNELWETRSKTLPRHSTATDSTNNLQSLAGRHNAPINQKLPVWKPGGNNFNHPSMSAITNIQKIRPASTSSVRKRNTAIERTGNPKLHQRTAETISGVMKDPSKISEKSITKLHNASSQSKIGTITAKGHHSEVVSLDRSKVQVTSEIEENRSRKPRSKSRTRTKTPSKISRLTVTEIPLEHAENYSSLVQKKVPAVKELPLSRKASSSPKDIILMLEELIKSSGNEISIQNAHPVHVVPGCDVAVNDVNKEVNHVEFTKSEEKPIELTNPIPVSEKDGEELAENLPTQMKSVEEMPKKSAIDVTITDKKSLFETQTPSIGGTFVEPNDLHQASNSEKVSTVIRSNSETTTHGSMERQSEPSVSNVECTAELTSEFSIGSVSSKCCQASLTSLTSHEISEDLISGQISNTETNSCGEGSPKNSIESFDSVENGEVTKDNSAKQFQKDQRSTSASSDIMTKKNAVNKHAKSLEMLKQILSDQGLGIHLLSRAKDELRDRCKCGSNTRGLSARRSLQGANLTTSRVERNSSTTLFGRLATLSESENALERAEAATMTSGNNSSTMSGELDSYRCREDEALLSKVVTVENATQFDITSKSDMCVGDGIICESTAPYMLECKKMSPEKVSTVHTSTANFESVNRTHESHIIVQSESGECKLSNEILNAFQLAADRAINLYTAVNILRENKGFESTIQSNSTPNVESDEILKHVPTTRVLNVANDRSDHVRRLNKAFNPSQKIQKLKNVPATQTIIPSVIEKVDEETKCKELMTKGSNTPANIRIVDKSVTNVKKANVYTTEDTSQNACHPNNGNRTKPLIPPKPLFAKAFGTNVEIITLEQERRIDPSLDLIIKNKIPNSAKVFESVVHHSSPSRQQTLVEESVTGKLIKTLHFAGRQAAPVVRSTSNVGSEDTIIRSNPIGPLNANIFSARSPKVKGRDGDPFSGSRIRTLLQENLQRLNTEYDPIIDGEVFQDFRNRILPESSDDEVLTDKVFTETTTSTSFTGLEDCNIRSEVQNLLNGLLNGVEDHFESKAAAKFCDPSTQSLQYRRIRKPVRRLKTEKTRRVVKYGNRPINCGKYWSILSGMIVSREHLLPLVYAVICSFVFCCLQFSVHCEV